MNSRIALILLWLVAKALPVGAAEPRLIFAHVVDGGGYRTVVAFSNPTTTATVAQIAFFRRSGDPWLLTAGSTTSSTFTVPLPAGGAARLETAGLPAGVATGWARVTTNPATDINGAVVIQFWRGDELVCEAPVAGASPVSAADILLDQDQSWETGIALANAGADAASGTLTVRSGAGISLGTAPLSLASGEQRAFFVRELVASAGSGRAQLSFTQGAVAVAALRIHRSGLFSTLPVERPGGSRLAASVLFSPRGGVRARIVAEIDQARSTIDIAIYSFTSDDIRDALIRARPAQARGRPTPRRTASARTRGS